MKSKSLVLMYLKMEIICQLLVWKVGVLTLPLPHSLERIRIDLPVGLKNSPKMRSRRPRRRLLCNGLVALPPICKTVHSSQRRRKPLLKTRLSQSPVSIYPTKREATN